MLPLSSKAYWPGGISSLETTEKEYLSMAQQIMLDRFSDSALFIYTTIH